MFARILGWLRLRPGPVVEQIPLAESAVCVHGMPVDEECGVCTIAAIDEALIAAAGDEAAVDRLLAARSRVRARQLRLRRSTPGRPS
jgi:hypothetical protein